MSYLIFICLYLFSISPLLYAKTVQIDFNADKIIDRIEYYENNQLFKIEEDRNGDKIIDYRVEYNVPHYFQVQWTDANFDSKFERKKSYQKDEKGKVSVLIEVDRNNDGTYEIQYRERQNPEQKASDQCMMNFIDKQVQEFSMKSIEIASILNNGLVTTGLGFNVENSCYKKWGAELNQIIYDVAVKGPKCLSDLHKNVLPPISNSPALRNAYDLSRLYNGNKISLICSETTGYNWDGFRAHASTFSADESIHSETGNAYTHPYVSLNPKYPSSETEERAQDLDSFRQTIFHETLHNLGYLHNEDIEFSYTCGECCFSQENTEELKDPDELKDAEELKNIACKLCIGDYQSETDINYIKDFIKFSKLNAQAERGVDATIRFMKENKNNTGGIALLAFSVSDIFNPIGLDLAKIIETNNTNLSADEVNLLANAKLYESYPLYESSRVTSNIMAQVMYQLYFKQDGEAAMALLHQNKSLIKNELMQMASATDNTQYLRSNLIEQLRSVIEDVWLNRFPSEQFHMEAYDLYKFFDFENL